MPAIYDARLQDVMARLKLRHLHLLQAVAEQRSVSGAATKLNVSQPAVSKSLREAETILGARLFDRTQDGLALTRSGRAVLAHGTVIQSELRLLSTELDVVASGLDGAVTVGAQLVSLPSLIPAAWRLLHDRNLDAVVRILDGTQQSLTAALQGGQADLVVGRLMERAPRDKLVQEVLFYEPIVIVAGAGHPLAGRREVRQVDLARAQWILPPAGSTALGPILALFTEHGMERPRCNIETVSYLTVRSLLMGNDMVAALPRSVVQQDVCSGHLVVLPVPVLQQHLAVGVTRRADAQLSPLAEVFIQCLREAAAKQ